MRRQTNSAKPKSCSCIIIVSWIIIAAWSMFLVYYWLNGVNTSATGNEVPVVVTEPAPNIASPPEAAQLQDHSPPEHNEDEVHVIFSTDCGGFQDWQSLLLFHSATQVGQRGPITRIASGCEEDKKKQLTELYQKLYPNYHVHFTPDFSIDPKTGKKYYFFNKPYGVLHWLDYAQPAIAPGTVVALIDPDFIFLRPLTAKMSGQANTIVSGSVSESEIVDRVKAGHPAAQHYGLGGPWVDDNHKKFNRTYICGEHSPCRRVPSVRDGDKYYAVGPPYILERNDMHALAKSWVDFVPRVYEGYPYLLAEMYAYSMAAAHEELPHLRADHFMVSNTLAGGEGWQWVDALPDVCVPPVNGVYFPDKPLPTFLHYCQFYRAGNFGFQKRRVPHDIFSCEHPMFLDFAGTLQHSNFVIKDDKKESLKPLQAHRNAFMLCVLHRSFNSALEDFKDRMCQGTDSSSVNRKHSLNLLGNH